MGSYDLAAVQKRAQASWTPDDRRCEQESGDGRCILPDGHVEHHCDRTGYSWPRYDEAGVRVSTFACDRVEVIVIPIYPWSVAVLEPDAATVARAAGEVG